MCRVLGVFRQGFYRWSKSPESIRKKEDKKLLPEIRQIFMENRQVYGPARIAESLRKIDTPCGKTRVKRLMDQAGLKPKRRTKYKKTTNSNHNRKVSPNLVNQEFKADRIFIFTTKAPRTQRFFITADRFNVEFLIFYS